MGLNFCRPQPFPRAWAFSPHPLLSFCPSLPPHTPPLLGLEVCPSSAHTPPGPGERRGGPWALRGVGDGAFEEDAVGGCQESRAGGVP